MELWAQNIIKPTYNLKNISVTKQVCIQTVFFQQRFRFFCNSYLSRATEAVADWLRLINFGEFVQRVDLFY